MKTEKYNDFAPFHLDQAERRVKPKDFLMQVQHFPPGRLLIFQSRVTDVSSCVSAHGAGGAGECQTTVTREAGVAQRLRPRNKWNTDRRMGTLDPMGDHCPYAIFSG